MAERLIAPVLKTGERESVPGVRIPLYPPFIASLCSWRAVMNIDQHVLYAIDDYFAGKRDSALMHASFAIDATARKLFGSKRAGRREYKDCLRNYYWIIEPMMGGGLNLEETRWQNLRIDDGNGKVIVDPDFADIIYHVFRCTHAHAGEVAAGFELLPVQDGHSRWIVADGVLKMPERVIWSLLAVSLFCRANSDVSSATPHYLTWGSDSLGIGIHKFLIAEHWGKEDGFREFLTSYPQIRVRVDGLDQMTAASVKER